MKIKSAFSKSFSPERYKSTFIFRGFGKNDIPKFEEIKTEIFEISFDEELELTGVSKNSKNEYILSVKNSKGNIYLLKEIDVIIPSSVDLNKLYYKYERVLVYRNDGKLIYDSDLAITIASIRPEPFDLDNL
jgi:hypothetical protein